MVKEKDKSFNNYIDNDEKEDKEEEEEKSEQFDEDFNFEGEEIPEEDRITDLTEEDLDAGGIFEGEKVDIETILNEDLIIRGIKTRPSSFYDGDYAIIQIEKDGKLYVINTSSSVLMDQIRKKEDKIPFEGKISKRKNPNTSHKYYTLAEEDLDVRGIFEGEKVDIETILNEDLIIRGIKTRPSSFYDSDYAIIQIEKDGKLYVINTNSSVLIDQIKKQEDKIPLRCKIIKHKSPTTNRRYYTLSLPFK